MSVQTLFKTKDPNQKAWKKFLVPRFLAIPLNEMPQNFQIIYMCKVYEIILCAVSKYHSPKNKLCL